MDDLEFERCRNFTQTIEIASNREYADIAEAFRDNMERIHFVAELPAEINYWSQYFGVFLTLAQQELQKPDGSEEVNQLANTKLQNFLEIRNKSFKNDPTLIAKHQWDIGANNFISLARSDTSGELRKGTEAMYASMLTSSWAALETLAIDLWIAAINKHPSPLATRTIDSHKDKTLPLNVIAGANFDLRNEMGSILYRTKRVNLEKFKDVRAAYATAFGKDWVYIFDKYSDLRGIEAIRHLFAHRSGRVDQRFIDLTADIPNFPTANIGRRIEVTGAFVANSVDCCVKCGVDLLSFVDKWSTSNAE